MIYRQTKLEILLSYQHVSDHFCYKMCKNSHNLSYHFYVAFSSTATADPFLHFVASHGVKLSLLDNIYHVN